MAELDLFSGPILRCCLTWGDTMDGMTKPCIGHTHLKVADLERAIASLTFVNDRFELGPFLAEAT